MSQATVPGKVILFGEHAVVYGRPAIAVPVTGVKAVAQVTPAPAGSGLILDLPDTGKRLALRQVKGKSPLAHVSRLALESLELPWPGPDWRITVHSTIPVAAGLGSGAAVATAIVRALAQHAGQDISSEQISALVFESETLYHGTASGIDNTVVAYQQPVWFVSGKPPEPFPIVHPLTLVIANTGIPSPTRIAVGDVRRRWQANPTRLERLFDAIADVAWAARKAIEEGRTAALGPLMDENHRLLQAIDVSCPQLDTLQEAARAAGAAGAKLSGAGRGGNLIALTAQDQAKAVAAALKEAGATGTLITQVCSSRGAIP